MQTRLFNVFNEGEDYLSGVDRRLSFAKFVSHVDRLGKQTEEDKHEIFEFILSKITDRLVTHGPLTEANVDDFSKEFYYIYHLLVPLLMDEQTTIWGMAMPVSGKVFYGTNAFYHLIQEENAECLAEQNGHGTNGVDLGLQITYKFILERLYDMPLPNVTDPVFSLLDKNTGLLTYFDVNVDNTFVDVRPKGELPSLDYEAVKNANIQEVNWENFLSILPLENFEFEGFSIISLTDVSADEVVGKIKGLIIEREGNEHYVFSEQLDQHLKILSGNPHLHTCMIPILKLNGYPTVDHLIDYKNSVLGRLIDNMELSEKMSSIITQYLNNPQPIIYNTPIAFFNSTSPIVDEIAKLGIGSYACMPLFYNGVVIGVLEIYADQTNQINKRDLPKLKGITPLLAQLCRDLIIDFDNKLDAVIKERFTPLQPAIQWKFNEAAWGRLRHKGVDESSGNGEDIRFSRVYPLYGIVDVRNSTTERNKALRADLGWQLDTVIQTLKEIKRLYPETMPKALIAHCRYWKSKLPADEIDTIQVGVSELLDKDVANFFDKWKEGNKALSQVITRCQEEFQQGKRNAHSFAFESSMREITNTINAHLDILNAEIQQCFPSYFDKFRTDGVEYDIYLGQSITPTQKFRKEYLKRIQFAQLKTMANIGRSTHQLLREMPLPMQTTQLIYVSNTDIDISFRTDERRFDVEGSYNIRYHVVKKRIDKVLIKGTDERLTQPGKIAIVYVHEQAVKNYYGYLSALINEGVLLDDVEKLELQPLQGVSGLKALRIGVKV